ncbi:MAG TPA: HlyD family efflux transporter periplasmic adaptor subunit [Stellaceae bacterium]|nr:HlyD family efflux transporter periplasmic adaptor subunit [Stellaceae bacterium]
MMMRRIWPIAIVAAVAAFAIPLVAIGNDHQEAMTDNAPPAPLPQHVVVAPGIVEPATEERDIAASVTGTLEGPMPAEGQKIAVGDIIAEVQNQDLKAELAVAEAQVAIRQNELDRLMAGARTEERQEAAAELQQTEAQLQLAQKNFGRRQTLVQRGIASVESADAARADYQSALARRNLMAARVALINAPPRPEDVAIATANLTAAKAQVADLNARIEKTRMRSPINGIVLKRYKEPGETVSNIPPTLVAIVGDVSHLRVRAEVDEADIAHVQLGQHVTVTADAFGQRRFTGTVVKIGSRLGPKYIKTDAPGERFDTKVLDTMVALDGHPPLPSGLRVTVLFDAVPQS